MIFRDRVDAGERLAAALQRYRDAPDTVVLGIPRGGVVVAKAIAVELYLPLSICPVRKLGAPGNSELAIGAVDDLPGNDCLNSDRRRDGQINRPTEHLVHRPYLANEAARQHGHSIAERQRIDAVVRNDDAGNVNRSQEQTQFLSHRIPQWQVEGGKRLVEQDQPWISRQPARQSDALAFSS